MSISPPSKILIVMPRWVGDAVMATPLIEAAHESWPQASIHLLQKRYLRGLFDDAPWSGKTIEISKESTFRSLRSELAHERYDLGFLLPNSLRPALLLIAGRVKRRVGYRRNGRAPLLTHGLPFPSQRPFAMIDFYNRLGEALGLTNTNRPMKLHVSDAHAEAARALLTRYG
ncbi:MAG: glycosyltransferase family 9 protein, partial [Planctomycetota bacterium]|nr:glycosyltransferase family 9 protein [Planctomycetota bacterium]